MDDVKRVTVVEDEAPEPGTAAAAAAAATAGSPRGVAPTRCGTLDDLGDMAFPRRVYRPAGPRAPPAAWGAAAVAMATAAALGP